MNEINTEILISRIRSLADEKGLSLTSAFIIFFYFLFNFS